MEVFLFVLLWAWNFGVSWFNARAVGRAWGVADLGGPFFKLLLVSGAIMAWCGFTWCFMIPLALLAGVSGYLPPEYVEGSLKLGYLLIIGPVLASGTVILIHSWMEAVKRPGLLTGMNAAYNTYAMYRNVTDAASVVPSFMKEVGDLFRGKSRSRSSSSGKGGNAIALAIMVGVVIAAAVGSTVLTVWIIRSNMFEYANVFDQRLNAERDEMLRRDEIREIA